MLNTVKKIIRNQIEEIKGAFGKRDIIVAVVGISFIAFLQYINHNYIG